MISDRFLPFFVYKHYRPSRTRLAGVVAGWTGKRVIVPGVGDINFQVVYWVSSF
jgi:hypothetical protein